MIKLEKIKENDSLNTGREKINTAIDGIVNSENTILVSFLGKYESLDDLKKAFPNGSEGTFLVKNADGTYHSYIYNNNFWEDLGLFQNIDNDNFKAENIVSNNDVKEWIGVGGILSMVNNVFNYTVTSLSGASRIEQVQNRAIAGHKYYLSGVIIPKYAKLTRLTIGDATDFTEVLTKANAENKITDLVTAKTNAKFRMYHSLTTDYLINDVITFKNLFAWDLTETFGAGNEPKTKEEAELYLKKYPNGFFNGIQSPLIKSSEFASDISFLNAKTGQISNVTQTEYDQNNNLTKVEVLANGIVIERQVLTYDKNKLIKIVEQDTKNTTTTTLNYDTNNQFLNTQTEVKLGGL